MNRNEIADNINYRGKGVRTITTDYKLELEIGSNYSFYKEVESWSGENCSENFIPEVENKYIYVFVCDEIEGHEVDYENEEECEILNCEGCESEGEVLVKDTCKMEITYISTDEDYKEIGYYEVELERIRD